MSNELSYFTCLKCGQKTRTPCLSAHCCGCDLRMYAMETGTELKELSFEDAIKYMFNDSDNLITYYNHKVDDFVLYRFYLSNFQYLYNYDGDSCWKDVCGIPAFGCRSATPKLYKGDVREQLKAREQKAKDDALRECVNKHQLEEEERRREDRFKEIDKFIDDMATYDLPIRKLAELQKQYTRKIVEIVEKGR